MTHDKSRPRNLAWDACFNVRDLGGHLTTSQIETRWNAFVRADSLNRLRPAGETALTDYGVRTVIDLRTLNEIQKSPNPFHQRQGSTGVPKSLHIPIITTNNTRWHQGTRQVTSMLEMYRLMLDACASQFAAVIQATAQADAGAVAFYCHSGKDRTGVVAALLLALAGVPHTTIAEDYAMSDQYLGPIYEELRRAAADQPAKMQRLAWQLDSLPETMMAALTYLEQQYGGAEPYLRRNGITSDDIERVRNCFLT